MSWSQILHFKRQLRVLHFLEPLKSQTALSNLNHPGSSPAPQTYAAHYVSTEIYCNLAQQSLWSPRELICTPVRQGVSPGQLACGRKAAIYPEATGAWVLFCFSEYWEIPRIHPRMKGCLLRCRFAEGAAWEGLQRGAHHSVPQAEAPCAALHRARWGSELQMFCAHTAVGSLSWGPQIPPKKRWMVHCHSSAEKNVSDINL